MTQPADSSPRDSDPRRWARPDGGLPHRPRGAGGRDPAGPPHLGDRTGPLPRHPRGPARTEGGATPHAGDRTRRVPRHPRGARDLEKGQVPQAGDRHGDARHHRQSGNQAPVTAPPPGALRPYARALLTLATEVRAEGLALRGGRRSHGPIGKGGNRCVA